eukprot:4726108-Amphidinium_carterae.1
MTKNGSTAILHNNTSAPANLPKANNTHSIRTNATTSMIDKAGDLQFDKHSKQSLQLQLTALENVAGRVNNNAMKSSGFWSVSGLVKWSILRSLKILLKQLTFPQNCPETYDEEITKYTMCPTM